MRANQPLGRAARKPRKGWVKRPLQLSRSEVRAVLRTAGAIGKHKACLYYRQGMQGQAR